MTVGLRLKESSTATWSDLRGSGRFPCEHPLLALIILELFKRHDFIEQLGHSTVSSAIQPYVLMFIASIRSTQTHELQPHSRAGVASDGQM